MPHHTRSAPPYPTLIVGSVFVNLRQLGVVTLVQVYMPHSMPFALIYLFQNLDVTFYETTLGGLAILILCSRQFL